MITIIFAWVAARSTHSRPTKNLPRLHDCTWTAPLAFSAVASAECRKLFKAPSQVPMTSRHLHSTVHRCCTSAGLPTRYICQASTLSDALHHLWNYYLCSNETCLDICHASSACSVLVSGFDLHGFRCSILVPESLIPFSCPLLRTSREALLKFVDIGLSNSKKDLMSLLMMLISTFTQATVNPFNNLLT